MHALLSVLFFILCVAALPNKPQAQPSIQAHDSELAQPANLPQIDFHITATELTQALTQLAQQAQLKLTISPAAQNELIGYQADALNATLNSQEALKQLLADTPFKYKLIPLIQTLSIDFQPPPELQEEIYALDDVTVIGVREKDWIYSDPNTTTIISKQELERIPPLHAADMLTEAAGVFVAEDRSNSGIAVNVRGMQDFGRVNMSIDGARQNYQQTGHGVNGHAYVDPALIRQIQIEKGPTASVNGAGVIGGIVNFKTINASDVLGARKKTGVLLNLTAPLGDLGNGYQYSGSAAGAFRLGGFDFLAALSKKEMKAYQGGNHGTYTQKHEGDYPERVRNMVLARTHQSLTSHFIKTGYDFSAISRLQFSYNRFMDDSKSKKGNNKANSSQITSDNYQLAYNHDELNLTAKFTRTVNDTRLNPKGMFSRFEVHYQTDTLGLSVDNASHFRLNEHEINLYYGAEHHLDRTLPEAQQIKYALKDGDFASSFSGTTPKGDRALSSVFSRLEFNYDDYLIASLGLRYDHYQMLGKTYYYLGPKRGELRTNYASYCLTPKGQDDDICYTQKAVWGPVIMHRNKGKLLPSFSLGVNLLTGVQPFITYAQGWRPPAITESLMYGLHLDNEGPPSAPNPYAKEEISNTWELGVNFKFNQILSSADKFRAKLAAYHNQVENYITLGSIFYRSIQGFGYVVDKKYYISTVTFVNLNNPLTYKGLELEADYEYNWLYLKASVSQTHLNYSSEYEPVVNDNNARFNQMLKSLLNKQYIIMVKPPKYKIALNTELRLHNRKLRIGLRGRYMSQNELAGGPQNELTFNESYVLDFYQSLEFKHVSLRFSVENLLDRLYATPISLGGVNIAPGSTALITVSAKF